jgi:predicted permease
MTRHLLDDIRYALRTLRLNPGFACAAVLSLTLGIGANTAIFSLVDAVLLRSLPVADPDRLVFLSDPASSGVAMGIQNGVRSLFTYEEFEDLRDHTGTFTGVFCAESNPGRVSLRVRQDAPDDVRVKLVSGTYFEVLGTTAVAGRTLTRADDAAPGAAPFAVLGHDFWQGRFGGDRSVVGRPITLNRTAFTIVGVLPPAFHGETVGASPDLYVPIMMQPQMKPGRMWLRDDPQRAEKVMWLHVGARLKPRVTLAQAQANVDVVFRQYLQRQASGITEAERRDRLRNQKITVAPGGRGASVVRERFAEPLVVLMAIVGLVLLLACANVANLLLARATGRQKEVGIRVALGAGRLRLVRQLLTESVVLAGLGGVAGVLFAQWTARVLVRVASAGQPSPIPLDVGIDGRMLAFTAALSLTTGVVFGLAPAIRGTRVDVNSTLKEHARGVSGSGRRINLGKSLVVGQVAISLLLLVGAGLFVRALSNLEAVDLGYSRDNLLLVRVDPVAAGYNASTRPALYQRVLDQLRTLPGVRAVTLSENGLFSGTESGDRITVEGYHSDKEDDQASAFDQVGPAYFSAIGIPVKLGREFDAHDVAGAVRVCVVNEAFAKFYFGSGNPIGKHVTDEFPDTRATFEIVGVVRDARDHRLRDQVPRRFYLPVFQPLGDAPPSVYYIVRTASDANRLLPAVRKQILQVDAGLSIVSARTLDELLGRQMVTERMLAQVAGFFSVIALVLAGIGLYGVLAYSIARRTHEIGIRMALGATQRRVLAGVLGETLVLVAIGLGIGVPAALVCGRFVQSALYGLGDFDPVTLLVAVLVIAAVSVLAGLLPARCAAHVDPLVALRYE